MNVVSAEAKLRQELGWLLSDGMQGYSGSVVASAGKVH
jgi:hypothetical protein